MRGQRKNPRKAVQPFENKKRKIDIFKNYEANGVEKIQRKLEIFSTLISKKSNLKFDVLAADERRQSVSTVINHNRLSRQPLAASAFLEFCLFVEFFLPHLSLMGEKFYIR